ncbi:MAG TPA: hypothetical protein PKA28_17940 [Methylomusa anaerophila]|nr:hypothetical protein [Methylomusa anaerophila]HML90324.1 hypothetical protein [Methylomusa anaerophila]
MPTNPIRISGIGKNLAHFIRRYNLFYHLQNVIRRILEYYFMQLCGYDGVNIRKGVLADNDNFVSNL